MLAVRIEHFGLPAELQIQTLPEPTLTTDEVLVQVDAAGINPSDVKNVAGNMLHTTLPRIPGRDFAGVVVAGAADLIDTEVWGTGGDIGFTRDGSHADYIILPKSAICPKPQTLSMAEAGSIGVTYVTAWLCLDAAQLMAGETLLVIGATGGVGSAAMQIAKWQGAQVVGTVRKESDRALAQQIGADIVINLAEQALPEAVKAATQDKGAAVILDTVGGSMVETCLRALQPKGRLVEISAPAKERRVSFDLIDFYHQEARLLGVDSRSLDVGACAEVLRQLTPGFESKALRPPATGVQAYPLQDAIAAYEQVLNHTATGRVTLTPNH
jgi:NADPH:quinone reductase-like Zn-dependent oxidoreductase